MGKERHTVPSTMVFGPTELSPSLALDSYWRFASSRQQVYFARLAGDPGPWTNDPVIATYKFTNAFRAADRVSQFLIRHVIYGPSPAADPESTLFRILLFKFFNKIGTWHSLEHELGSLCHRDFCPGQYSRVLSRVFAAGIPVYSAAYIMASPYRFGNARKHDNHLALIDHMMRDSLCVKIGRCRSMAEVFELLSGYPGIGPFLAYQLTIDINYSELTDFSENDFVEPGPGALDGIQKVFPQDTGLSGAETIRLMVDSQEREFDRLGIEFANLFGRRLQLIDCQNLFCEVGKYSRVAHPELVGTQGRSRIKQRFVRTGPLQIPWFPPKWGINARVADVLRDNGGSV